jgi:hypothetical protein
MNVPLRQSVGTLSLLPVQVTFKASVNGVHAGVTDNDDEAISDTTNASATLTQTLPEHSLPSM